MRPLVIYHKNCADGFGAAWVFYHRFGPLGVEFHPGSYGDPPPGDISGRHVYLVDFSYKLPVVRAMLDRVSKLTILDHHKSAIEDLEPVRMDRRVEWCCDLERSGAMLAWDYCYPAHAPLPLIKHIQDRDLWQFKLENTREIQSAIFSYQYNFMVWSELMLHKPVEELVREGQSIERKHFKDLEELIAVTRRDMVIGGHRVPVANMPYMFASDAGHLLSEGYPFGATYYDSPEGRHFSLRSRVSDGMDVSEIAKMYGGGGHKHAAGFKVDRDNTLARQ